MNRISVVIPTFNRADVLPRAVESVLAQTVPPFEIIVIDDGSTDGTVDALRPFTEKIRYIKTENRGVSAARNRGVEESLGDFIAFLDSDDTWHREKLEIQSACVERTGAGVCFCASADEDGNALDDIALMNRAPGAAETADYPAGDSRFFRFQRHPFVQAMLVRKDIFRKEGPFDETLRVAEDTKLIHRIALDTGCAVINRVLVTITRNRKEPGLSDSPDPEKAAVRYDCYLRVQGEVYWRLVPSDPAAAAVVRKNLLYFASRRAEIACALGDKPTAVRLARQGSSPGAGARNLLRNAYIAFAYPLAERAYSRKWGTGL